MLNLKSIQEAFKKSCTVRSTKEPFMKVDTRSMVVKQATGNGSLQLGKFVTESDIAARRQAVCNYNFRETWKKDKKKQ